MFELSKHASKIAHLNIRTEKHGEEEVLAADVKIEADVTNDFLSYLHPTLKWSLYDKQTAQGELIEDKGHLPRLRYAFLREIRWADKIEKAVFIIHGKKKAEDIEFEAGVDKLSLACKEGGTVAISFRAAVLPTPEQTGFLSGLLGVDVKVSVREIDDTDPVRSVGDTDAKP